MNYRAQLKQLGEPEILQIIIPTRFMFLLEMHPYKCCWGGRNGLKSWSFADALLALGANQRLRIVCGREVMNSLADSCHALLKDRIEALKTPNGTSLSTFYSVLRDEIRGANGTSIKYAGLSTQTIATIKSFEGVDIFWVEEADEVTDNSWNILLPTIRAANSEVWISFNPGLDTSPTYVRWVKNPPPGTVVKFSDYKYAKACGFFTEKMDQLRIHQQKTLSKEEYENIWDGLPRTSVVGAIYATEIAEIIKDGRYRPTPYDPRFPVHRIWDLGWNDAMSIIMVQKTSPTSLNVINYLEDRFQRYDQLISDMKELKYNFGDDWLPHDGDQHDPKSGTSAKKMLRDLGCTVKDLPKSDPELRVKASRMMFPRVYIDNSLALERKTGHLGTFRLMDCLKRYKRHIPKATQEPTTPVHDEFSHACLVAGSLIETARGQLPIEDVVVGDNVWTPAGYSRVIAAGPVKIAHALVEVVTDVGALMCTPEHKILSNRGFIPAGALRYCDRVYSGKEWQCCLIGLFSKGRHIGFRVCITGETFGDLKDRQIFIGLFGKMRMALFQMGLISTMQMAIRIITRFRTSVVLPAMYIKGSMLKTAMHLVRLNPLVSLRGSLQQSGTGVPKVFSGISSTPKHHGKLERGLNALVINVVSFISRLGLRTPSSAMPVVKIQHVVLGKEGRLVYDLTVEKNGCYQANGLLVSNCDAWGGLAEIVDQIRNTNTVPAVRLPAFRIRESSTGTMG